MIWLFTMMMACGGKNLEMPKTFTDLGFYRGSRPHEMPGWKKECRNDGCWYKSYFNEESGQFQKEHDEEGGTDLVEVWGQEGKEEVPWFLQRTTDTEATWDDVERAGEAKWGEPIAEYRFKPSAADDDYDVCKANASRVHLKHLNKKIVESYFFLEDCVSIESKYLVYQQKDTQVMIAYRKHPLICFRGNCLGKTHDYVITSVFVDRVSHPDSLSFDAGSEVSL